MKGNRFRFVACLREHYGYRASVHVKFTQSGRAWSSMVGAMEAAKGGETAEEVEERACANESFLCHFLFGWVRHVGLRALGLVRRLPLFRFVWHVVRSWCPPPISDPSAGSPPFLHSLAVHSAAVRLMQATCLALLRAPMRQRVGP